jgi:presenilin-like A22 family membrane protease
MISLIFAVVAVCWGALSAYFVWRFVLRRKPQSAVIALACLGWPVMVARELRWYPRALTTPLLGLAVIGGLVGVAIVWQWESQRPQPFR